MNKTIGLASDHAGFDLKKLVTDYLMEKGWNCKDFGTHTEASCDYADFAHPLASAIEEGELCAGIAICGSGNGISMTLNKHLKVRAALCWNSEVARLARAHNNANILVLPARFIDKQATIEIMDEFLNVAFEGGRHQQRIEKMVLF
jgi:ribose 5-phosphate isomerase B